MGDGNSPSDDLDRVFLNFLQQIDGKETISLKEFILLHKLSDETARNLEILAETAKLVEEMAGPRIAEVDQSISTQSHKDRAGEETLIVNSQDSATTSDRHSLLGSRLGEYEILEELGRGGMGVVYKARQTEMDRDVALKMIKNGCLASESDIQRFYFEARSAGKLKHPGIVQVYQVGELDGHHYFTMEYIEGVNLFQFVQREELTPKQIAQIVEQVSRAIDFAHQHGVLHRDLKPSNVLVDSRGNPRITDFGLAKDLNSGDQLTTSGSALGTPSYMPPEQAQAFRDEITCRSDVYSLGAILYRLLTHRPPFRADSLVETLMQVIHSDPIPPRSLNQACPPDLEAICLKCLQKSPADRYPTAADLGDDLERFVQGERVIARGRPWYSRGSQWLRNVPLLAAITGRKPNATTKTHLRFQWGVVCCCLVGLLVFYAIPRYIEHQRFFVVDISTGEEGLSYEQIGRSLSHSIETNLKWEVVAHASAGAGMSHDRLLSGEADIAFLQENTLESSRLKVLAPLYLEAVLIIIRKDVTATEIKDLRDLKIALGAPGSGMRISSRQILNHFGLLESDLNAKSLDRKFSDLAKDQKLDGAIVTIKVDDKRLMDLLNTGDYKLLMIPTDLRIPGLRTMTLRQADLPGNLVPVNGIHTPATFAILAVRSTTPDRYVTQLLQAFYNGSDSSVSGNGFGLFSLKEAAAEKDLNYHEAARRYFKEAREAENH